MMGAFRKILGGNSDLGLVILIIGILIVLFTPIPPQLLDFLILTNFSFALLILLITFYVPKPVEFSTFPSLLLVATLFRLSLNIAATRLILAEADAGRVIGAIGAHVVQGNYVIGFIVFLILIVVQYVVITNGAQRVSEVAARFTLDAMPGQQMSIDADLNMGFIDQDEAKRRRKNLEKEASFYGAMDGASKFVKGDAIAGIIILLIDVIGGLVIGMTQLNMPWAQALQTFTLLTIGDGIVTQVPALVIAVGTGIIVTRSASDERLSHEILKQTLAFPKTLMLVVAALGGLMFLPGIPAIPTAILMCAIGTGTFFLWRRGRMATDVLANSDQEASKEDEDVYRLLTVEPVEVNIGASLVPIMLTEQGLFLERINAFRKQYALDAGFVIPAIKVKDNKRLGSNAYEVRVFGVAAAAGEIFPERILAIHPGGDLKKLQGVETKDPTYGLPAYWIGEEERESAQSHRYTLVDSVTVFITHLSETLKQQAATLLTRSESERMIGRVREQNSGLIDELIPTVLSLSEIQRVLQNLLREKVSIRNIEAILEVLVDAGRQNKDPTHLTEIVRQRLGSVICQTLSAGTNQLHVLTLEPTIEQTIARGVKGGEGGTSLILEPRFTEQLLTKMLLQVEKMMKSNLMPVLLCAPEIRRHIRTLTERLMPHLSVVSMAEVPNNITLKAYGVVGL
jgi:flagellar biosynthesis protein FlhA